MSRMALSLGTLLLMLVSVGGCQEWTFAPKSSESKADSPHPPEPRRISVSRLANQLDLNVDKNNGSLARLSNAANSVTIFADPNGSVHVNGSQVGGMGDIYIDGDELTLPQPLLADIRRAMKPLPAKPLPRKPVAFVAPPPPRSIGKVVLDAGHGGKDPGANSATGVQEKQVVLAVTLLVAESLRDQGVTVVLTRKSDVFVELDDRVAIANRARPDLFVSIHADHAANRSANGFTVFAPRRTNTTSSSHRAATRVNERMAMVTSNGRGVRRHTANLRVLENTRCPAILIELGFLSNRYEAASLATAAQQRRLAAAITQAVLTHLKAE